MFNFLFNNNNNSANNAPADSAPVPTTVTVQFALEETQIPVTEGLTIGQALSAAANELGFRPDRITTARLNGSVQPFSTVVKAGDVVTLSISAESKGC